MKDFAEWLSPVLVKELRQGLRSRAFVGTFLALQGVLAFNSVLGLLAAAREESTAFSGGLFWTLICVFTLMILPMGGLAAITNEQKANTLELVFLTNLTARRILLGKWLAIVAQTALIVCTALPYAVLRYFLGRVNLGMDLMMLLLVLGGSAFLAAITVGLSPFQSKLGRGLTIAGIVISLQAIAPILAVRTLLAPIGVRTPLIGMWLVIAGLFLALLLMLLALEIGSARIAPQAENHSTPKRLISLLLVLTGGAAVAFLPAGLTLGLPALLISAPLCLGALADPVREIPSIYRPFVRRGIAGRIAGRLLYPGWPAGVLFVALLLALAGAAIWWSGLMAWSSVGSQRLATLIFTAIAASLLAPSAIQRTLLRGYRRPLVFSFLFYAFCGVAMICAMAVDQFAKSDFVKLSAILPPCSVLLGFSGKITEQAVPRLVMTNAGVAIVSFVLLCTASIPLWKKVSGLEARAMAQTPPDHAA
jgi:hypothetical protein